MIKFSLVEDMEILLDSFGKTKMVDFFIIFFVIFCGEMLYPPYDRIRFIRC